MEFQKEIFEVAKRVYETLGPGHEEVVYREAMSIELQDRGYLVKTEMPVNVPYKTSSGKEVAIGATRVDLYIEKGGESAIIELKAVSSLLQKGKEGKDIKELWQLKKYLSTLGGGKVGYLVNFPFPPKDEPEIISAD